jgi:gliding motility-associated-like protein
MHNFILLFISLLATVLIQAQNISHFNDNWMFPDQHSFNFTSGTPTYIGGTVLSNPNLEGVSAISDGFGNILFYSDAQSVYDANNNPMPNGNMTINGYISATSACVITKMPGDCDKYYIFTLQDQGDGISMELRYSIVDMTLNGGSGDVVSAQSNVLVYNSTALSEKMISAQKGVTEDYWIIVRSNLSDDFYSFEVTAAGVTTNPVISNVSPTVYSYSPSPAVVPVFGWLAVSSQNNAIVEANGVVDSWLYDFNNITGVLSNQEVLINNTFPAASFKLAYGCEFSPNGQIIYIGLYDGAVGSGFIYQFDRSGGPGTAMGTLQTYPMPNGYITMRERNDDEKIYFVMGGEGGLSVIDDPDNFAAPNILINNYLFSSGVADLSLANDFRLWNEQVLPINFAGTDDTICQNDSAIIGCNSCDSIYGDYQWQPANLIANGVNNLSATSINLNSNQIFTLSVISSCGDTIAKDSILIEMYSLPNINAYGDTTVPPLNDAFLSASGGNAYVWSPSSGLSCSTCQYTIANVTETTIFYVTVTDTNGCLSIDSVEVKIEEINNIYIPNVFSPNDDGHNDVLFVRGTAYQDISFRIFNRWGEKVFETTDIAKGWDGKQKGKLLNPGVFVYQLIYTDWQNIKQEKSGNVTLIK